ncbi:hypothetical protein C8R45DRAFT_941526 [Mycena sanguinolenta]|nr:hypothetical protein C8R45DRAFT_941526 [Mycena sanguinolenta]
MTGLRQWVVTECTRRWKAPWYDISRKELVRIEPEPWLLGNVLFILLLVWPSGQCGRRAILESDSEALAETNFDRALLWFCLGKYKCRFFGGQLQIIVSIQQKAALVYKQKREVVGGTLSGGWSTSVAVGLVQHTPEQRKRRASREEERGSTKFENSDVVELTKTGAGTEGKDRVQKGPAVDGPRLLVMIGDWTLFKQKELVRIGPEP